MNKKLIEFSLGLDQHLISHINAICCIAERHIEAGCPEGVSYPLYTALEGFSADNHDGKHILVRDVNPELEELNEVLMQSACVHYPDNINEIIDDMHEFSGCWGSTKGAMQHLAMKELYGDESTEHTDTATR